MGTEIGRVEWLDIRDVWRYEAVDFTPWLLANVDVLRDALGGLDLVLEAAEHTVGRFSLDLIGWDRTNDARLIVENQIEPSDHRHLGQLLTYAAGVGAGTIVWVAKTFSEEHLAALAWLNERTGEDLRFFAVEIRAVRIGDSPPAPMLAAVAHPNEWQKTVRRATAAIKGTDHTGYVAFWAPLRERLLAESPELLTGRAVPKSIWLSTSSPVGRTPLACEIGAGALRVVLEIDLNERERNLSVLEQFRQHRGPLEAEAGAVDFDEGKVRCKIVRAIPWEGRLLTQPERHDEARTWFYETMQSFRRGLEAVAPLIDA